MPARAIMLQGTGSSVGKSLLVAGLCRAMRQRGMQAAPFKPQNMSNNAAVAADGGEIGRAQALQARAAGLAPSVHMNPVLLKPQSDVGSQVVVHGKVFATARAREYQKLKPTLLPHVLDSFARLKSEFDAVIVEGAGSASEINLRANDIANMGFARAANIPVVVVGSIDSGGVIAALVGTKAVLDAADAALVVGFIVNRMRGDPALFADGMTAIARLTGWTALGLVPFLEAATLLPAEDTLDLAATRRRLGARVRIAVPRLPRIANFDDLDPLRAEPDVELEVVEPGSPLPAPCDLVILPGSKATVADLAAFRAQGWDVDLAAHVRRGGRVLGLCGGYQMLGRTIADPGGIEGPVRSVAGLGLLDVTTELGPTKALREVEGQTPDCVPVRGYEMHMGVTTGRGTDAALVKLSDGRRDGAVSADGRIAGTYLHGFFADDRQRAAWIARLGGASSVADYDGQVDAALDTLAAHVARHVDLERLIALMR